MRDVAEVARIVLGVSVRVKQNTGKQWVLMLNGKVSCYARGAPHLTRGQRLRTRISLRRMLRPIAWSPFVSQRHAYVIITLEVLRTWAPPIAGRCDWCIVLPSPPSFESCACSCPWSSHISWRTLKKTQRSCTWSDVQRVRKIWGTAKGSFIISPCH